MTCNNAADPWLAKFGEILPHGGVTLACPAPPDGVAAMLGTYDLEQNRLHHGKGIYTQGVYCLYFRREYGWCVGSTLGREPADLYCPGGSAPTPGQARGKWIFSPPGGGSPRVEVVGMTVEHTGETSAASTRDALRPTAAPGSRRATVSSKQPPREREPRKARPARPGRPDRPRATPRNDQQLYNFGVHKVGRNNRTTRRILQVDFSEKTVFVVSKGQRIHTYDFTKIAGVDSDDGPRFTIQIAGYGYPDTIVGPHFPCDEARQRLAASRAAVVRLVGFLCLVMNVLGGSQMSAFQGGSRHRARRQGIRGRFA